MIPTPEGQSAELRLFDKVMDKDNPLKDVAPGYYRELRNCRNSIRNRVENIKGFQQVMNPYMYLGTNKIVMQHEDLKGDSIIFAQYNSFGYHGIFRWFRNVPNQPFGVIEKIIQVNHPNLYSSNNPNYLNLDPDSLITGTALVDNYFFWNEYRNSPKVIDLVRANETDKHRQFNICFNKSNFALATTYTINLYEPLNPIPIFTTSWTSAANTNYQQRVDDFVNAMELLINVPFEIVSCVNSVKIEIGLPGRYFVEVLETTSVSANQNISLAVPDNFYPDKDLAIPTSYDILKSDLIGRMRPVPFIEPTISYATDPLRQINLVKDKAFQFRCQYVYFDFAKSSWGAISNIALPSHSCSDNNYGNNDNYLNIDFSDPRLENASLVNTIKYVNLAVREHNTGLWKLVKTFEQYEVAGPGQANYKFYNDGNYAAIDQAETTLPFYSVPNKAQSLEIVDDRLFDGGIIEGYDKPCADVKLAVDYLEQITPSTYKATGRGYIKNFRYGGSSVAGTVFPDQVIYKDTASGEYRWGGFCRDINGNNEAFSEAENHKQTLPLGGFIAYLAGTNFFGKTIQKYLGNSPTFYGLSVEAGTGAIIFDQSSQTDRENMWDYLDYLFTPAGVNNCYQEFVISGIPNGRYVQRFASHLTTPAELSNSGLNYQTRSTNAFIFAFQDRHEIEFIINNANFSFITVGDWILADLSRVVDNVQHYEALMGYLVDGNGLAAPTTSDEYMALPRIDLARTEGLLAPYTTDHNGYFFATNNTTITFVASGTVSANVSSSINLLTGAGWVPVPNGMGEIGVFRFNDSDLKQNCRTRFIGKVVDPNGDGVAGVAIINTRGQWGISGPTGDFSIIGYADTIANFPSTERNDKLIFSTMESVCLFSFSYDSIVYSITINDSGTAGTYNDFDTNPLWYLATPNMIATLLLTDLSISAFGRGVDIPIGIEYLDDGDRVCSVAFIENLHIKWYNETIQKGRPVVSWQIFHEPPSYAVKWKFMRGLSSLQNQLMWDVNEVTSVGPDFTTPVSVNPSFWRLNFDNIAYYVNNKHPQAVIAFTFQKGDRVRFVKNGGNNYYNVYYDVEIVRVDNNDVWIEYDANIFSSGALNNTLVQLYTPRGTTQTRVFFEFGETYPVRSAFFFGVRKYYHVGQTQDQSYGPLPFQIVTPAEGIFKTGDQYYRLREMPTGVDIAAPSSTGDKIEYIYDQSISDFYLSNDQNIGRSNTDSIDIGKIDRPTAIRFSDRYISGTKINGLCAFQPLNQKQFSTQFGLMMKLINQNDDLLKAAFMNSVQVDMYINKGILREATGQLLVAISEDVIPRTNKLLRTFGTQNPESIWINDEGDIMGWDENQGVKWRSSGNGLIQISDYGTKKYHKDISNARCALNRKKSQTPSVYDLYFDEYITLMNALEPDPGEAPSLTVCLPDIDLAVISALPGGAPLLIGFFNPLGVIPIPLFIISKNDFANYTDFSELVKYAINQHLNVAVTGFTAETTDNGCVTIKTPNDSATYGGLSLQFDLAYQAMGCDYINVYPVGLGFEFAGIIINGITYPMSSVLVSDTVAIANFLNALGLGTFTVTYQVVTTNYIFTIQSLANTNTVNAWLLKDNGVTYNVPLTQSNCVLLPLQHKYFVYNFSEGSPIGISQVPFPQDSIAFCKHPDKNGWTAHYDYDGLEMWGRIRNDVVAFKDGQLWLLEALGAPDYNKFFGIKKPGLMRYPVNKEFEKVKVWNQLTIDSDSQWYIPVDGFVVPPNKQTPQGMKSELNPLHFELVEGLYGAALLNDTLTPNEPTYDEALINGRPLRGQAAEVLLQNDEDDQTVLNSASVGYEYSER